VATWHDTLFRFTFGQVRHARSWLRGLLPPKLAAAIDWRSLRPWPASRAGLDLRLHHGDLLFAARLRGSQVRVFFLIEHKSGPDPCLVRQLHRYVVHIASERSAGGDTAPFVIPVVVHHGRRPLRIAPFAAAREVRGAVAAALDAFAPRLRILLDDLTRTSERALRRRRMSALARLTLLCLRSLPRLRDSEALAAIERWGDILRAANRARGGPLALQAIAAYILHQTDLSPQQIAAAFARTVQERDGKHVMSTADRLIAQGRAEGRAEGRAKGRVEGKAKGKAEGKCELVLRLLTARFGSLPPTIVARVRAATARELDRLALRLLDAKSLAEIFAAE
jgi:predicted transposase/invertase (TIGR01784 family)